MVRLPETWATERVARRAFSHEHFDEDFAATTESVAELRRCLWRAQEPMKLARTETSHEVNRRTS